MNGWEVRQGTYFQDVIATKYDGGMDARFEWSENEDAVFSGITTADHSKNSRASCLIVSLTRLIVKKKGYVFTRGGYVELSKKLSLPLGSTLDRYTTPARAVHRDSNKKRLLKN